MSNASAIKQNCYSFGWEHTFIIQDQNLLCVGGGLRILKLEPALLSETLVLVPLTWSMGVLIAAILHKLSSVLFSIPRACAAVSLNETTAPSHSLCCSLFTSLFLSFHFASPLHLRGQVINDFRLLIGWWMILLAWLKAHITQRIWNGKGEKEEACAGAVEQKCFDKQPWKREDGDRYRCMHVTTVVGHAFTDVSTLARFLWETNLQISFLHPLPVSSSLALEEEDRQIAQCPTSLPRECVRAWGGVATGESSDDLHRTQTVPSSIFHLPY